MSVKERIEKYLSFKGISNNAFEISIGASKSYLKNTKNISTEILTKIIRVYSDLSLDWVLFGEGDMIVDSKCLSFTETRPRIPYDAEAGRLTDAVDGITEMQCERLAVVAAFPKYDFTIRVTGRSMEPMYFAGDEVACLRVNESQFLQWGRVHVLDTSQGVVIKRIYENGDSIRCSSFNPEYPDFNVPKADIRSYNLVVGALRL